MVTLDSPAAQNAHLERILTVDLGQHPGGRAQFLERGYGFAKARRLLYSCMDTVRDRWMPMAARCKVVVADDNHDAADALVLLVNSLGYAAVAVYDGNEAIAAHDFLVPSLMIFDIQMPLVDGYQSARHIRSVDQRSSLRLAALTSLSSDMDRRKSAAAGFDDHFVKPMNLEQLRALLASCVGAALP
jgi:CheY-like chemotaxis protein